ncbi:sulfate transporter [Pilimelia terevasa]|uniref:Sulfate transporter n=1 Tax=Pilimelia terevasa TaxID=53372 RepID=A0A8J3BL52_9ACTN|nr:SulP family inorganic anion transporter [Pilimelia terevasa]GGK22466.1 sulfate transporter [Pilimelia terevasa]
MKANNLRGTLRTDLPASVVVFLVALPLCVGVAVASGVPAEVGLVTGIVGGLVVGLLPGSTLQVSGPAAGLTVLVAEAVAAYGIGALGIIVLAAGCLQIALGALRLGRWFRAISVAVVQGMLAGIGLLLVAGQLYVAGAAAAPGTGLEKIIGLPGLVGRLAADPQARAAAALSIGVIGVIVGWGRLPARVRTVPGVLVAVVAAGVVTAVADLPVATIDVRGLADVIRPPFGELGRLADLAVLGTVVAFTLIASAESLFSAAAVDRMHDRPRTDFDKELVAQGVGNTLCGALGALPLTAVIVRSSANVRAGARTRASRVLHGVWLLLFAAALPGALALIPLPALAGVLIHAGVSLLPVHTLPALWREHRGEAVVVLATAAAILATDMFQGVLIGLALAVGKLAWETSHVRVDTHDHADGSIRVAIAGNATFLRLPAMLTALADLPADRRVHLDLRGLRHLDHACQTALNGWVAEHNRAADVPVVLLGCDVLAGRP